MGLLRVLLALSVLFEHSGGIAGYHLIGGPLAVQCFFIISGFYMGLVLNERYDRPALNMAFYRGRVIRIFSVYYLFLALHLAVFAWLQWRTGDSPLAPYFGDAVSPGAKLGLGLLNLTVIGQDLPLWLRADHGALVWQTQFLGTGGDELFHFMLIPAAWSLSLELCFYIIAPFIARRPVWQIAGVMALSLAARVWAAMQGWVADPASYRFFPFELALFLAGVLAYRLWASHRTTWQRPAARLLALAVPAAILLWPLLLGRWSPELFFTPPRLLLLTLVALGLPAIHEWSHRNARDRAVGELSYPLYLDHLLVLGLISGWPVMQASQSLRTIGAALVGLLLAWLVVRFVDQRIEALRRRLALQAGARF